MNEWIDHPSLKDLDPLKLELIRQAASRAGGRSGRSLAPVMMSLIAGANKKNIRFSPEEIRLILEIFKEGKSPEEQAQIDQTLQMVSAMLQKK